MGGAYEDRGGFISPDDWGALPYVIKHRVLEQKAEMQSVLGVSAWDGALATPFLRLSLLSKVPGYSAVHRELTQPSSHFAGPCWELGYLCDLAFTAQSHSTAS